jgi:hypothetical protein
MWHACGKSSYRDGRKEGHDLQKLSVDDKIILKWFFSNNMGGRILDSSGSGYGPILVSYKHGNGTRISGIDKQLLASRAGPVLWSYGVCRCSCILGQYSDITPKTD